VRIGLNSHLPFRAHAAPLPCCAVALRSRFQNGMVGARRGHGVACGNQMRKTESNPLAARHGRGTAWARHAMCELALTGVIKRSFYKHPELSPAGQAPSQPGIRADEGLFPQIFQHGKHAGWDEMALRLDPHTLETYQSSSP